MEILKKVFISKKNKRELKEKILDLNIKKFYNHNLKNKVFHVIKNFFLLYKKISDYYLKSIKQMIKKREQKKFFVEMKLNFQNRKKFEVEMISRFNIIKSVRY